MGKVIGLFGVLALFGALAYVGLTAAYRLDMMDIGQIFNILQYMTVGLVGLGALSLGGGLLALLRVGAGTGLFALIAGVAALAAASGPMMMRAQSSQVPVIHDISTDIKYPPVYYAVRDIRAADGAHNSTEYNPEDGAKQLAAYPQLRTLSFDKPYEQVFAASIDVLEAMGLEVIDTEENAGRIEATATTIWWGFKDDVVVRVNRFTAPVEVDIRSNSRVGRSDLGANAKRIEIFMRKLEQAL